MKSWKIAGISLAIVLVASAVAIAATRTVTYSSGDLARAIGDKSTLVQAVKVPNRGKIKDVNVSIRIDHTNNGDLVLGLISPRGEYVTLTNRSDTDNGPNLGDGPNDCAGNPTSFDSQAATKISGGASPYAGSFRPDSSLSILNGDQARGTWRVVVIDGAQDDTGTLGCVKLRIKRST